MKLKSFLLTTIFTAGFIIPSCNWGVGSCGDLEPVPNFFNIESMGVTNFEGEAFYSCCSKVIADSAFVELSKYWMRMDFDVSYYFGQVLEEPNRHGINFMGSALACSPAPPGYNGSQEKIESLTVITLNDFDDNHHAGDTINDLVDFHDFSARTSLNDFLSNNISFIKQEALFLQLKAAPTLNPYFKSRLVLKLTNGEEYSAETNSISFY